MGYIADNSVTLSGREAKAMAKFCGKKGYMLFGNGGIYLASANKAAVARIRLSETHKITGSDMAVKTQTVLACDNDFNRVVKAKGIDVLMKAKVDDAVVIYTDADGTCDGKVIPTDKFDRHEEDGDDLHRDMCVKLIDSIDKYIDEYSCDYCGGFLPIAHSCFANFSSITEAFGFSDDCCVRVTGHDLREDKEEAKDADGNILCYPTVKLKCGQTAIGGLKRLGRRQAVDIEFLQIGFSYYKKPNQIYRCDN